MADDPLNRARRQLLSATDSLLERLDKNAVGESLRGIAPALGAARATARERAVDIVVDRGRRLLEQQLGVDLGWEMFDRAKWAGPEVSAIYARRLDAVADWLVDAQARGRNPRELLIWTRYWQHQIAGSDVHKVARGATMDMVGNTPDLGRFQRIAEPNACGWCRGLATRGAVYYSSDTASSSGHAHCRCEVVAVTDAARIAETRQAGAEAWEQSTLSTSDNPFRGAAGSKGSPFPRLDPELTKPGAATVERRVAVQAQLASYQAAIDAGRGTDWMRAKMLELAEELDELDRLGIGVVQRAVPAVEELPAWHRTVRAAADRLPQDRKLIGRLDDGTLDSVEAKVYRSAERVPAPGPVALSHLDAVLDAGRALDDELEARIAARVQVDPAEVERLRKKADAAWDVAHDAYKEAIDLLPEEMASRYDINQLSEGQKLYLRSKWAVAKKLPEGSETPWSLYEDAKRAFLDAQLQPGSRRYNTIVREEAIKLLSEVRDVGNGTAPTYVTSAIRKRGDLDEVLTAMERARQAYPTAWVEAAAARYPSIDLKVVSRGYNQGGGSIALSRKTANLVDGTRMDDVAIHELGHTMEWSVPGLRSMEWLYFWRRALPTWDGTGLPMRPQRKALYGGNKEVTIPDEWRELYSGKFYGRSDKGPGDSYEIFTTGIESLMSGSSYFHGPSWDNLSPLGVDREFRAFILGVLSVL